MSSPAQPPEASFTVSELLYDVYRLNQERLDLFFQRWLDWAYANNERLPNVIGLSYLAACKANRKLLEFYLGYKEGFEAPPAAIAAASGPAMTAEGGISS